jgi:energy-converting hydrogenase Eha subunit H
MRFCEKDIVHDTSSMDCFFFAPKVILNVIQDMARTDEYHSTDARARDHRHCVRYMDAGETS